MSEDNRVMQPSYMLVLEYIKSKVTTNLLITPFNIIFGHILVEINQQPINTILLVAKIYI